MLLTKKSKLFILGITLIAVSTGCSVNQAFVGNVNSNQTVVELAEGNFNIMDRVEGQATTSYILVFGGFKKKNLHNAAMADLLEKANLSGSQALANVTTEYQFETYLVYHKVTVVVSAHVVEFE